MNTTGRADWRDYSKHLTAQQFDELTQQQARFGLPADEANLVDQAREHAEANRRDAERFGHVAAPAGAQRVTHWELDERHGGWCREFELPAQRHGRVVVGVEGVQYPDASVRAFVTVDGDDGELLGAADARQVAALLCEAAEVVERLTSESGG